MHPAYRRRSSEASPATDAQKRVPTRKVLPMSRHVGTLIFVIGLIALLPAGCNMRSKARFKPYEPSAFFENNQLARPLEPNTVALGQTRVSAYFTTGRIDGEPAAAFPAPVTREVLERGQERYNIYCAPCHGLTGYGDGMIVQRGFMQPPSYHTERLRNAPPGYFVDVITNGFGQMYSYADRVSPDDRWAITAYIRALQHSQNAALADVPPEQRSELEEAER